MARSPTSENPDEPIDSGNDESGIVLSRRDALIGAVAAGFMSTFGIGSVTAQSEEEIVSGDLNIGADGETLYYQPVDGELEHFRINSGNDHIMRYTYDAMDDDYIIGEVALGMEGNSPVKIGEHVEDTVDQYGGTVEFTGYNLWGSNKLDLSDLDFIDDDYGNLNADPIDESDPDPTFHKDTSFTLRFRITSSDGSISEEKTIGFNLSVSHPLGFGVKFGRNFGKNHPEDWENSSWVAEAESE